MEKLSSILGEVFGGSTAVGDVGPGTSTTEGVGAGEGSKFTGGVVVSSDGGVNGAVSFFCCGSLGVKPRLS